MAPRDMIHLSSRELYLYINENFLKGNKLQVDTIAFKSFIYTQK